MSRNEEKATRLSFSLDRSKARSEPAPLRPSPLTSGLLSPDHRASEKVYIESLGVEEKREAAQKVEPSRQPTIILEPLNPTIFGLQHRKVKKAHRSVEAGDQQTAGSIPSWLKPRPKMESQYALEQHLRSLPDGNDTKGRNGDDNEKQSLSGKEFGLAALRSMGWREGERIGRMRLVATEGLKQRAIVTPIQFVPRPERLGLGADPNVATVVASGLKEPKRPASKPDLVAKPDAAGRTRHFVGIDEVLVTRPSSRKIKAESRVEIAGGVHAGLTGRVARISEDKAEVVLDMTEEPVQATLDQCKLIYPEDSNVAEPILNEEAGEDRGGWMHEGLAVRFKSRVWQGGRFYNKRGIVEHLNHDAQADDVYTAMIVLQSDKRRLLQDVPASALQACPSQVGRPAIVLRGEHAGSPCRLIEKLNNSTWMIQLDESMEVRAVLAIDLGEFTRPVH